MFRETDVLVLPSIWPENQPVSITEAMATKTPVIASDMGGIPELIEDGVSGWCPLMFGILNQRIWDDDLRDDMKYRISD